MNKDEAMKKAEEALPCQTSWGNRDNPNYREEAEHPVVCPAFYRPSIATLLLSVDETAEKRGYVKGLRDTLELAQETSGGSGESVKKAIADGIRALITEPEVEQSLWRNISSAPKDGTGIIICADRLVGEARWKGENADEGWWWAGEDPGDYHADKIQMEVTHWQPLPSPPVPEKESS